MKTLIPLSLLLIAAFLLAQFNASADSSTSPATTGLICANPDVVHSTLVGDLQTENANGIVLDQAGNVFVGGTTFSTTFPPPARQDQHGVDAITMAFSPDLSQMESQLWVNVRPDQPDDEDEGLAMGIDAAGNRYFIGRTRTVDFCNAVGEDLPGHDPVYDANGSGDGFLVKQNADGTPAYCTFIGGGQLEIARGLYVYPNGEVLVTGGTWSASDFPVTTGVTHAGTRDVFVTKYSADGNSIIWSTLIGGAGQEAGLDITVDPAGDVYLTGWTFSTDLPVSTGAAQTTAGTGADAFFAKLSSDGTTREYISYLGGDDEDRGNALAVTDDGKVVIVGTTNAANFPTTANAYDATFNGTGFSGHDVFLTVVNSDGSAFETSTYVGGIDEERAFDVVLAHGEAYVTGYTKSETFPVTADALDDTLGGGWDAFIMRFDLGNYDINYSTFFGGSEAERGNALVINDAGHVVLTGETRSDDFCTTAGAYDETLNGDYDMFISELIVREPITPTPTPSHTPTNTPTPTPTNTPTPTPTPEEFLLYLPAIRR